MSTSGKVEEYDLVILGSGAGAKLLAWTFAERGKRVAAIERKYIGGACPNIACLPSKNIIHTAQIAHYVRNSEEFGIATEGLSKYKDLASFQCYEWSHVLVVPDGHPLLTLAERGEKINLPDLATWPLITYDVGFTGRGHIDDAFRSAGYHPDIVLTAMDADVIGQYVALDMGVGIVASMAVESLAAYGLKTIPASHLFRSNITRLAVRRGTFLRSYVIDFIQQFSPTLSHEKIVQEVIEAAA